LSTFLIFKVNLKELQLLWEDFQAATSNRGFLTKSDFIQLFPELDDEMVLRSIFSAFARFSIRDENIDFEEYVMVLSIMSRGSIEQRIDLSFTICDLNKNGFVSFDVNISHFFEN
jgi:Ca2+-binding EF-hand superfamily protein